MWVGKDGWKKFRKSVLAGVHGHAMAYKQNAGALLEIQILACGLEEEIINANTQHQTGLAPQPMFQLNVRGIWRLHSKAWV